MSTFLELCQRARQECAIAGTGPSAVTNQTGEMQRVVDWVNSAWMDIQRKHATWRWMRTSFSVVLAASDAQFTAADAGLTSTFGHWLKETLRQYGQSAGVGTEGFVYFMPYDRFRDTYMLGSGSTGGVSWFTIQPDNSIRVASTPTVATVIRGEYQKRPTLMTENNSVPDMPEEFHEAIVYRAMMKYGRYAGAAEIYEDGKREYRTILNALEANQLPDVEQAEPMVP